jgi:Fe2+ transport system protein B
MRRNNTTLVFRKQAEEDILRLNTEQLEKLLACPVQRLRVMAKRELRARKKVLKEVLDTAIEQYKRDKHANIK